MANPFQIRITAQDSATKAIMAVTKKLSGFSIPIFKASKALTKLGKSGNHAFNSLSKGLRTVADSALHVVKVVGELTGVGVFTGLLVLAERAGNFGFALGKTSRMLNVSTQDLASWHVAAEQAGVSAETFDQAIGSAQGIVREAWLGGNAEAVLQMQKLGVELARNKDGTVDYYETVQREMRALGRMKTGDPAQLAAASAWGLTGVLPMIQQGTMDRDRKSAFAAGLVPTPAEQAQMEGFFHRLTDLKNSVLGMGLAIGQQMIPILEPLVTGFSAWLNENRVSIAEELGAAVKQFADWLKTIDWAGLLQHAKDAFDAIGGVKGVLVGLALMTFSGPIAGVVSLAAALISLGAFLVLNPIGMVITLVTALAGLGYLLVKNWDDVKAWWHDLWSGMADDATKGTQKITDAKQKLATGDDRNLFERFTDSIALTVDEMLKGHGEGPEKSSRTPRVVSYLMSQGLSRNAAIGMAANYWQESTYNPAAENAGHYGIGQWDAGRQEEFKKRIGVDMRGSSLEQQLRFGILETQAGGGDKGAQFAGSAMPYTHSANAAAQIYSRYAERPGSADMEAARRGAMAQAIDRSLPPLFGVPAAPPQAQPTSPQEPQPQPQSQAAADPHDANVAALQHDANVAALQKQAPQQLTINVNAPPGTTVDTKGGDDAMLPTKINYSMGVNMGAIP